MKKRFWIWGGFIVLLFLIGCTRSGNDSVEQVSDLDIESREFQEESNQNPAGNEDVSDDLMGEKVSTSIYLTYETKQYVESIEYLKEAIRSHKGEIESSVESTPKAQVEDWETEWDREQKIGEFIVRIPVNETDPFLASLEENVGIKSHEEMRSVDQTQQYTDLTTRLETLENTQVRLEELLEQAETVEDILSIEQALIDIITEKEIVQRQIDGIDQKVDFTTVYITILEESRPSNRNGETGFWSRVKEALLDSLYAFYYWIQDAAIWIIYAIPYILFLSLGGWLLIKIGKRLKAKKK
ncbi:DUF4349 domain-containing protein [Lacticigenium naphthae]|uniref:DUF4349 domain-containing protein n=1 Tax=Lacticigenium naphthae TaxID=515351 RepID=UPI00042457A8|nr:DUF4349 domain-containing protein [Lacticigenium naphthae]